MFLHAATPKERCRWWAAALAWEVRRRHHPPYKLLHPAPGLVLRARGFGLWLVTRHVAGLEHVLGCEAVNGVDRTRAAAGHGLSLACGLESEVGYRLAVLMHSSMGAAGPETVVRSNMLCLSRVL